MCKFLKSDYKKCYFFELITYFLYLCISKIYGFLCIETL